MAGARVTSALWVAAYIRRIFVEGGFAAVVRHGADEAGSIFVVVDRLDGTADLYSPAPQTAFGEDRPSDRLFIAVATAIDRLELSQRLASELKFDPDIWVIEIEERSGRSFLDTVPSDPG